MSRFFSLLFLLGLFGFVSAQTPDQSRLDEIEKQQAQEQAKDRELAEKQATVKKEIAGLQTQMVSLAGEVEALEVTNRALGQKLASLEARETGLESRIYEDQKSLARLLAALQRVENNPPPALAISPQDATNAARAARLMSSISDRLNSRANALRMQLQELADIRTEIEGEQKKISENRLKLDTRNKNIKSLIKNKSNLEASISKDRDKTQARVKALAGEADNLRELIRKLEETAAEIQPRLKPGSSAPISDTDIVPRIKPGDTTPLPPMTTPPDTLRFADARGRLKAPAQGYVSEAYSRQTRGMTVTTAGGAQVVAPYTGRIEFSGPFKNYENVVIMNVGDGYFLLMTGLGEVYAESGTMVALGEPVGLMPFNAQNKAKLYIEIRKNGSPVNPNPWLGTAFARQG